MLFAEYFFLVIELWLSDVLQFDFFSFANYVCRINEVSFLQKGIVPFVQQIFMPLVNAIFSALSQPIEENDHPAQNERQLLQRSYFLFIAAIVTNNITEVISSQGGFLTASYFLF